MKIAIVGAGAMGAYFGIKLALAGHDVHFLLRSDFEIVRERGFVLQTRDGTQTVRVNAHKSPEEIGACDLALIALKATANASFETLLRPVAGAETLFLTIQNGFGNVEKLSEIFGAKNVLGGLSYATINRTAPGVIKMAGRTFCHIGEAAGNALERTRALAETFREAGLPAAAEDNYEETVWKKLCWNVPFNGLAIVGGNIDCAQLMARPELVELSRLLMRELQAAARARGCDVSDEHLEEQITLTKKCGAYLPSTLLDFRAGKPLEIEAIWGEPLRMGRAAGVEMPHLETLYLLLKSVARPAQ